MSESIIRRTYFGGNETISFADFARNVIQDDTLAREIAEKLIAEPGSDYPYNEDAGDPEVYEVFCVYAEDAPELRAQLNADGGRPLFADEAWAEIEQMKADCRYSDDSEKVDADPELGSTDSLIAYKNALEDRLVQTMVDLGQAADDAGWDGS